MGRPKLLDREHVVYTALCQYWQHGVDKVGMADIARLSGFDRAGIYKEFGGEPGLVNEAMTCYMEAYVEPRVPILAACSSPVMTMKLLIDAFIFDNVIKNLEPYGIQDKTLSWPKPLAKARGCAWYGVLISETSTNFTGKTKRQMKQIDDAQRGWFVELLTKAEKENYLKSGLSVEEATDFCCDQMMLLQLMRRQGVKKDRMNRARDMILRTVFEESASAVLH